MASGLNCIYRSLEAPGTNVNDFSEISNISASLVISVTFKSAVPVFVNCTFELYGTSPDPMNSSKIIFVLDKSISGNPTV